MGTGTSESLGRRPSLRPQLGEKGGGSLPSPAKLFLGLLTTCGANRRPLDMGSPIKALCDAIHTLEGPGTHRGPREL